MTRQKKFTETNWTLEEEQYLRSQWLTLKVIGYGARKSAEVIAKKLKRTIPSVLSKAVHMRLQGKHLNER